MNDRSANDLPAVTTLRFVAALIVYVFHIHTRWPITDIKPLSVLFRQGAIGMSVFFILSGFVLALRYYDGIGIRKYFANRFARIYPVYIVAALITVPYLLRDFGPSSSSDWVSRLMLVVLVDLLLLQAWFPQLFEFWNNDGSWSISAEAFFYSAFPLALQILKPLTNRMLGYTAFGLILLGSLPGLSHMVLPHKTDFPVFYAIPIFRFPEFLLGTIAGIFFVRGLRISFIWACIAIVVGSIYFLLGGFRLQAAAIYTSHHWLMLPLISAIILASASLQPGQLMHRIIGSAPLVYLGRLSYSFYSMQLFVILFLIHNRDAIVERHPVLSDNLILGGVTLLVLLLLSALCFHCVEEPCRKYLSRSLAGPKTTH